MRCIHAPFWIRQDDLLVPVCFAMRRLATAHGKFAVTLRELRLHKVDMEESVCGLRQTGPAQGMRGTGQTSTDGEPAAAVARDLQSGENCRRKIEDCGWTATAPSDFQPLVSQSSTAAFWPATSPRLSESPTASRRL